MRNKVDAIAGVSVLVSLLAGQQVLAEEQQPAQTGLSGQEIAAVDNESLTLAKADDGTDQKKKNATRLETVTVVGNRPLEKSILPARPVGSIYGTSASVLDTPRSITQINADQLTNDSIQSADEFVKYAPGITRGGGQNASIVPQFRAQGAEIFQDGQRGYSVRHPTNLNAYEGADIVAGPSSVVFGSVTGSGGYVNYLAKKPNFTEQKTTISGLLGTWIPDGDSRSSTKLTIDNTGPITDTLAYRVSYTRQRAEDYYDNVENNFNAYYLALAFKPTENFRADFNVAYDDYYDWNITHGWNRPSQELVDSGKYWAGRATPIIQNGSQYWSPVYASGAADSAVLGWERRTRNANGQYTAVPGSFQAGSPNTQGSPGTVRGWVYDPNLPGNGLRSLSAQDAQRAEDQNESTRLTSQLRLQWDISQFLTVVNSTLLERSNDTTDANGTFQVAGKDNIIDNRSEFRTHTDFELFGIAIGHESNSGFSYRNEYNRSLAANNSFFHINAYDLTQNPSTKSPQYLFGLNNLNPAGGNGAWIGTPGVPQYSSYFGWLNLPAMYPITQGDDLYAEAYASYTQRSEWSTKTVFTQQNFRFEDRFGLNIGASRSFIDAEIENPLAAIDPQHRQRKDSDNYRLFAFQVSPYFKPTPDSTVYLTYDRSVAVNTGGFTSGLAWGSGANADKLNDLAFRSFSELYEGGFKADLIPGQLFFSVAGFHQARDTSPDSNNNIARLVVKGYESTLRYQPTAQFSSGINFSKIKAYNEFISQVGFAPRGFVPDNGTVFSDNNVLNQLPSGRYDAVQIPEYTISAYADYQFQSGFGIEVSTWWTSDWYVNLSETVHIPNEYNIDTTFYYRKPSWGVALKILNVTDELNFENGLSGSTNSFLQPLRGRSVQAQFDIRF